MEEIRKSLHHSGNVQGSPKITPQADPWHMVAYSKEQNNNSGKG